MNILISRTDRAGDLVLTMPMFSAVRRLLPEAKIFAHVTSYTSSLLIDRDDVDHIILDDTPGKILPVWKLAREFKREKITHAVFVHPSARALTAGRLAGIPVRIGRASNVWQILLNRPVVQNRSRNEKHEFEYNLDLLKGLNIEPPKIFPRIFPDQQAVAASRRILDAQGMRGVKPIIVHPGSGGSAYNPSLSTFLQLIERLKKAGFAVITTLGPNEIGWIDHFKPILGKGFAVISGLPDLRSLAEVIANGAAFIGGSTGPMHIAAALGIPTVAFFPPQRSMTPARWGPVGNQTLVITPSILECSGDCRICSNNPCMDKVDLSLVMNWLPNHTKVACADYE